VPTPHPTRSTPTTSPCSPANCPASPGSEVVVAGHVRRRFFRAGGVTQSRTEVVATRVIVNGKPAAVVKLRRSTANVVSPVAE
jgi:single-strand DNA-binding protein